MRLGVCIAAHGAPANDFPEERLRQFFALSAGGHHHGGAGGTNLAELEREIRSWPRTPENDPYKAGVEAVASSLRWLGYDLIEAGFNEFCDPTVEEAIERLIAAGAETVVVASTMLVPGGGHAEIEIAGAVAAQQAKHSGVRIVYAWPYDTALMAELLAEQVQLFAGKVG